jgi:hypothetical protein
MAAFLIGRPNQIFKPRHQQVATEDHVAKDEQAPRLMGQPER